MSPVTWEEQLDALQTLEPVHIRMRAVGDWYVSMPGVMIELDVAQWNAIGYGATIAAAVDALWQTLTTVAAPRRIVVDPFRHRRTVRWTGARWETVPEP